MTIQKLLAEPITAELSPNIPDPEKSVLKTFRAEGLEIRLIKNGIPISDKSIVVIPWAMAVLYEGEYIYAISLEKEDLRILASFTGESLKDLQADYGVRGFYTSLRVSMYGDDLHEDIGPYTDGKGDQEVENYLMDAVLDSFDVIEDPVEV